MKSLREEKLEEHREAGEEGVAMTCQVSREIREGVNSRVAL